MKSDRERFIDTVRAYVKRDGVETLLRYLDKSDFYTAPASTKYHDSEEGGLCKHSLNVFAKMTKDGVTESKAIVSLFHDLCKVGYYKVDYRNSKENGVWVKVPYYTVDDRLPYGHGEKSVLMIQEFMKLTLEEAMAIRWHMGGFEPKENYGYLSKAFAEFPLALELHIADLRATYEKE